MPIVSCGESSIDHVLAKEFQAWVLHVFAIVHYVTRVASSMVLPNVPVLPLDVTLDGSITVTVIFVISVWVSRLLMKLPFFSYFLLRWLLQV